MSPSALLHDNCDSLSTLFSGAASLLCLTALTPTLFIDFSMTRWPASNDAPPPDYTPVRPGCSLADFRLVTVDDVVSAVRALSDKQCASDALPTRLLKDNIAILAPFLTELFNRSLSTDCVPAAFREAYITPRLKKADLDSADVKSYRPISNLSVLSKLLERLVARHSSAS